MRFMILHWGFAPPSDDDMAAWNEWFALVADKQVERGGLGDGREFGADGARELPVGPDSLTGYTIVEAADFEEAASLAQRCPIVATTQVFALRG